MNDKIFLKDRLFNKQKMRKIAGEIKSVYREFADRKFIDTATSRFQNLALKERITWIAKSLKSCLPNDFRSAAQILLNSLPPIVDPSKSDNDFGDFVYASYSEFVAIYGCTKDDLIFSLLALKQITQRFSVEDAIRYFINEYPDETLSRLLEWTNDSHYHVRRLCSEGTRPKLPWSKKISIPIESALPILDNLYFDQTRFVTRSVANHLNDIAKINPDLVIEILSKWKNSGKQNQAEMTYIINHSLRTLIKQGNQKAFSFLQFSNKPKIAISNFRIKKTQIKIGGLVEFSFLIKALEAENLLIDYIIWFQNKKGEMKSRKVFKLKKIVLTKNQIHHIQKNHILKEKMTTRVIYPGDHKLEIQINGKSVRSKIFTVYS